MCKFCIPEGFFIDGELIEEGHVLGEGDSRYFLLEMAKEYNFKREDVKEFELIDEDDEYLSKYGRFPKKISELKGEYTKL